MLQSLTRRDLSDLGRYGHVVVDECHHVPAFTSGAGPARAPGPDANRPHCDAPPSRRPPPDHQHAVRPRPAHDHSHRTRSRPPPDACSSLSEPPFDLAALPPDPGNPGVLGAVAADRDRTRRIATDVARSAERKDGSHSCSPSAENTSRAAELIDAQTERVRSFTAASANVLAAAPTSCSPRRAAHRARDRPLHRRRLRRPASRHAHARDADRLEGHDDPVRRPAAPPPRR